ncbi:unnamed protein product [Ectocarpus sp. CCAP 1310/34]|nr:unnamed protein product [Ectocarpus sp. CCAP 1310/34]
MSSSADQQQPADASSTSTSTSTSSSTFEAAKNGDADFIQAAILDGVDVNKRDSNGERRVRALQSRTCSIPLLRYPTTS